MTAVSDKALREALRTEARPLRTLPKSWHDPQAAIHMSHYLAVQAWFKKNPGKPLPKELRTV